MYKYLLVIGFLSIIVISACSDKEVSSIDQLTTDIGKIEGYIDDNNIANVEKTSTGLHYVISDPGSGGHPENGQRVTVHYTGKFLNDTPFDSSHDRGEPISFTLGIGQVIQGWEEGIPLFQKGGTGTIFLPSSLAYGKNGSGSVIGPNEVLIFDIELVDFN